MESDARAPTTDHDDARRDMWRHGSYEVVGDWFRSASIAVLDGIDVAGRTLLDVGTGTGAVAIEAARRGAEVTGLDLTAELLVTARQRADAAGVPVRWVQGDFDAAPIDGAYDVVVSSFGVIFAPDPQATAARLAGWLRPAGGVIGVAAWVDDSVFSGLPTSITSLLPDPIPTTMHLWATAGGVTALFAGTGLSLVGRREGTVDIPFRSAEHAASELLRWSGGWMALFEVLEGTGRRDEGHRALVEHLDHHGSVTRPGEALPFDLHARFVVSTLEVTDESP